jgi:hypothetical protein
MIVTPGISGDSQRCPFRPVILVGHACAQRHLTETLNQLVQSVAPLGKTAQYRADSRRLPNLPGGILGTDLAAADCR